MPALAACSTHAAPLALWLALTCGALGCDDAPEPTPDMGPPPEVATLEAELAVVPGALDAALLGVWGDADDAVWFAGGSAAPDGGVVLRFDGEGIAREVVPAGPLLWWVWGDGLGAIYVCGEGGRVLARRGDAWVAEPTGLDEKAVLWGLWGSGPDDLWAVGGSVRRGGPKGVLLRSSGDGVWRRVEDPTLPAELNLYKVWGTGPDDVYLVGEGTVTLRWDGAQFTRVDLGERDLLFTVHGRAGGPVLAVGGAASGLAWGYRDGAWTREAVDGAPGLNGVTVRPDGLALATGNRGVVLLRDARARWFRLALDAAPTIGPRTLHAAWTSPSGSTWAVGGDLATVTDGLVVTDRRPLPALMP